MTERNGIKLIEYDDAAFRRLQTSDKLILLADAEQTNYENKMKLERQLARIQKLQYEVNEKRIEELEPREPEQEREPINVSFVPDKEKERRKRENEARSRAREIDIDMARGIVVSKSQLQKQQSAKLRRFQK